MLAFVYLQMKLQILLINTGDAYITVISDETTDTFDIYWWCLHLNICRCNYRYSWYVLVVFTSKSLLVKLQIFLIATSGAYIWISSDETSDILDRYITHVIVEKTDSDICTKLCLLCWKLEEINNQWYTHFINKDQIFYVRMESCRHFLNKEITVSIPLRV